MDKILDSIVEWLKEILVGGIVSNLSGMFDSVNQQVGDIAGQVGATPQAWNGSIYNMIRSLSDNVIIPIAGDIGVRYDPGANPDGIGQKQYAR